ncbi:MAG: hypothetical protein QME51_06625 [Planctomycetota bacterium]|nr:hypothetical protein [Planctomycetota bacterium]
MGEFRADKNITYRIMNLTAGLATKIGRWLIGDNQVFQCQDADTTKGGIRKQSGTSKLTATAIGATPVKTIYRVYQNNAGNTRIFLAASGTQLWKYNTGTSAFDSIKTGLTNNLRWSMVWWNGNVYMTNGTDAEQKYDLTTVSAMTGPAVKCKEFFVWNDRMWACGEATNPNRVYFSAFSNAESWGSTDYLAVPENSVNGKAVGFGTITGRLAVFCEDSISLIYGTDLYSFIVRTTEKKVGCVAPKTIKNLNGLLFFLGRDGVYAYNGVRAIKVSKIIQTTIDDINTTYIQNAVAEVQGDKYVLSYTSTAAGGTTNNRTLILDTSAGEALVEDIYGSWQGPLTVGFDSFSVWDGAGDANELYGGSAASDGFVYKMFTGTDYAGSNIDMDLITKDIDFGDASIIKYFKRATVIAEVEGNYDVTVSYAIDHNSSWTTLATINLAASGVKRGDFESSTVTRNVIVYPAVFQGNTAGYYIRLRIRQNGTGCTAIIREIKLEAESAMQIGR